MAWHLYCVLPFAWAIGAAGSGAPPAYPHPLCKALESYNNDDMFLQSLPAKYVCHGSDDGLACAASGIEKHEPAFQPREGNQVVGDAGQETLGAQNRTVRTASSSSLEMFLRMIWMKKKLTCRGIAGVLGRLILKE